LNVGAALQPAQVQTDTLHARVAALLNQ